MQTFLGSDQAPGGQVGGALDELLLHQVGKATTRGFPHRVARYFRVVEQDGHSWLCRHGRHVLMSIDFWKMPSTSPTWPRRTSRRRYLSADWTAVSKALTARHEKGSRMVVDRHDTGRCLGCGVGGGPGRDRRVRMLDRGEAGKP
jgi:hypothetical protein